METTPLQDIIIGNIPGICGTDAGSYKEERVRCGKHTSTNEIKVNDEVKIETEFDRSKAERDSAPLEHVATVQTRAIAANGKLPPKSLKIKTVPGLDIGPEELKEKQRSERTFKKYEEKCELARNELAK